MLHIYNSLTRKIEIFESIQPKSVRMYVCGPTVYSDIHLGNARPVIFFDVLKNYLSVLGYDVEYASNITDIDDKIIQKAQNLGITEEQVATTYTKAYLEMMQKVGSSFPDHMPKATQYIQPMIRYIQDLIQRGFAYETPSGVYFRVDKVAQYGQLSNQTIDKLEENVRFENHSDKEGPRDFTLWKHTSEGISFDSPFGKGRPGWHTECVVMNHDMFQGMIDIHGGGMDLKFPHHENEIAQSVAHDHHHLAKYWMHVGRLDLEDIKMSKSLGNVIMVKDLIRYVHPMAFRLLIVGHHYRQPIRYHAQLMEEYQKMYDKIRRVMMKTALELKSVHSNAVDQDMWQAFLEQMDQDLNTPNVMTIIQDMMKQLAKTLSDDEKQKKYQTLLRILTILGIQLEYELTKEVKDTYHLWQEAREQKNYQKADELREKLIEQGWLS